MDRFTGPMISLNYPIPKVVFMPILFILLGIGNIDNYANGLNFNLGVSTY